MSEFVDFEAVDVDGDSMIENETLVNPQGANNPDSFFYAILYTLRYQLA